MKILSTKEFLEKLNIGKLNIRDAKLIRRLPDELVKKYKLVFNPDTCRYDCDGDIYIESDLIKDGKLITDFGVVKGDFSCSHSKLVSLEGCPVEIDGNFWCHNNKLISLEGCPQKIGGKFFSCSENELTSLEGCPETVSGSFSCSKNNLTSLRGCPAETGGDFDCSENELTSLEDCPKEVGDSFWCSGQKNGHTFTEDEVKTLCNVKGYIHI